MSGGQDAPRNEADGLIERAEAAMAVHRCIMKIEATLTSIERLGNHLFNDINRHVYGASERGLYARQTAHAIQDGMRALTGRAKREARRMKEEHAASQGLPDLPTGLEPNATWEAGDGADT